MPTNIADEFADIAKRMSDITGKEGRKEPNKTEQLYWCYRHGLIRYDQTRHDEARHYRACFSASCGRPVLRWCDNCACTGWEDSTKQCTECNNPFDMKWND